MNTTTTIKTLNTKQNGAWFNIEWKSVLPLSAAAKKEGHIAYKITKAQCRKGIEYKKQQKVVSKVENGYVLKHELPWGQWKIGYEGLIIEHKGNDYLRLYFGPNKPKTQYYIDDKLYSYEELKETGLLLNSFFNGGKESPDCVTIKVDNIQKIW